MAQAAPGVARPGHPEMTDTRANGSCAREGGYYKRSDAVRD